MMKNELLFGIMIVISSILFSDDIIAQKYVGIFYSCWANECLNSKYGDDVYIMGETPYSPYPQWNWWGKPLYAATRGDGTIKSNYKMYFDSPENPNRDLIDWHAQLLDSAGVDFITLDLTNGTQEKIVNGAKAICKRYEERYNIGLPTPKIVFWVQDSLCLKKVETEIFGIYDDVIFFEYLGEKLVNVAGGNIDPAIPEKGIFGHYTCRRMWGLDERSKYWQFKVNSNTPPPPFYFDGKPEQMCAPVATQATVMTEDGINPASGAKGRRKGAYFVKYMDAAIAANVKFVFIHSWNEWTAQNLGTEEKPMFVDQWKSEFSSDIEPMAGGHGWYYYDLMCKKIAEFKKISKVENENSDSFSIKEKLTNYPNPFNPSTTISFTIPRKGEVSLRVFNSLGEEVAELINKNMEAGKHSILFNAGNLPSGTYFCRLRSGEFTKTTKLLLIK